MKKISLCVFFVFLTLYSFGNVPTCNPYKTRYSVQSHGTSFLNWERVFSVSAIAGLVVSKGSLDSVLLPQTIDDISESGGGFLYFQEEKYFVKFKANLKSKVRLRGANPSVKNAKNPDYLPFSELIYPFFCGEGSSNNAAFKSIWSLGNSMVLINLDINRAQRTFASTLLSKILLSNQTT